MHKKEQRISLRDVRDLHLLQEAEIFLHAVLTSDGPDVKAAFVDAPGQINLGSMDDGRLMHKADPGVGSHDILPAPAFGQIMWNNGDVKSISIIPQDNHSIDQAVTASLAFVLGNDFTPSPSPAVPKISKMH